MQVITTADTYLALGVRELWLVDPVTLTIEVRHLKEISDTRVWKIYRYSNRRARAVTRARGLGSFS